VAALQAAQLPCNAMSAKLLNTSQQQHGHYLPVFVLYLAPAECALLYLDLLIQQRQLVVAADELRSQNVALAQHQVELLLLPQPLCGSNGSTHVNTQ
jgi:hypothetical protein